jgi:hypothetical protein
VIGHIRKALILAGGTVIAAMSGYDAALAYYREHALDDPPALFADDPTIQLQRLESDLLSTGHKPPDPGVIQSVATNVLAHDPLNPQAEFMLGAARALKNAGDGSSQYLLAERISRRHIPAESALVSFYAQRGDVNGIVRCLDRIFSVSPDMVAAIMPALIGTLDDPRTRQGFTAYAQRPWMRALIGLALDENVKPESIAPLIDAFERAAPHDEVHQSNITVLRIRLLSNSLADGDYAFAQSQLQRLPKPKRAALEQLGFSAITTSADLAPISWTMANDTQKSATLALDGSVVITMAPEQTGVVAERITLLAPGRYKLSQRLSYSGDDPKAALVWDVACAGQDGVLWHQAVPTRNGQVSYESTVELPPACFVQHWSLRATGDIGQSASQATLLNLAITRQ